MEGLIYVCVCVQKSNINCLRVNVHELYIGTIYWNYLWDPCCCCIPLLLCYRVAALRFLPSYPGEVYLTDVCNSVNYPIDVCNSVNYPIDV